MPIPRRIQNLSQLLQDNRSSMLTGPSVFGWLKSVFQGLSGKYFGTNLTPAEQEANAWTAEREDTKYQRTVADMQAAGINPMMAVSNGAGTSQASVSPSQSGNLGELLSFVLGQQSLKLQKRVADADIAVKNAEKGNIEADTTLKAQQEKESAERTRGAQIVNDIKEATKENEIEASKLRNNLTRAQEKECYKRMDEIAVRMSKIQAETDTEYEKQTLMQAERCLKNATAWQIYKLTPALENYYNAQSQAARGAAAAAFVKAAYDYELLDNGYVDSLAKEAAAKAGIAEDDKVVKDIAVALRTGDWDKLQDMGVMKSSSSIKFGPDRFIAETVENYLQGATVLMDNLNPLVGILK